MQTPFDNPKTFMERLMYPTIRAAYIDGYEAALSLSAPDRKLGGRSWPPPPNRDEDDFEPVDKGIK